MDGRTDPELLHAAEADEAAFAELVGRHHLALGRYATRRLGPDRAADVVNETFAVAFQRRASYDDRFADAGPWLFGIETNLIRREHRREARQLRAFARRGLDPVAEDAPHADIDPVLAGVLAALRPEHRDVLFLHAVAELSHDEIARALGVPVGTARGWLSRARAKAAAELTRRGYRDAASLNPQGVPNE